MALRAGKQDTGLGHAELTVRLHREVKGERGGDWSWGWSGLELPALWKGCAASLLLAQEENARSC